MDILKKLEIINSTPLSYMRSHITMKLADKIADNMTKGKPVTKKEVDKVAKQFLDKSDYKYYNKHWEEIKNFLYMSLGIDYKDIKD